VAGEEHSCGKLLFVGVMLGGDYDPDPAGRPPNIRGLQVSIMLRSTASFPISFIVDEYSTSFDGMYPPNKPRDSDRGVVTQHDMQMFRDHTIQFPPEPVRPQAEGTARFKIRYGTPGREKYMLTEDVIFQAIFVKDVGGYICPAHRQRPQ